jgi:hypothetical protein
MCGLTSIVSEVASVLIFDQGSFELWAPLDDDSVARKLSYYDQLTRSSYWTVFVRADPELRGAVRKSCADEILHIAKPHHNLQGVFYDLLLAAVPSAHVPVPVDIHVQIMPLLNRNCVSTCTINIV